MWPGLIMKSFLASALGWGAGASGAYVSFLIARRTEFLEYQKKNSIKFICMTSYLTIENNSRVLLINLKIVTTGIKFKRAE